MSAVRIFRRETIDSRWMLVAAIALFAVLRLVPIATIPLTPVADCAWYFEKAAQIAEGLGYTRDGVPTAFYPIGYAAFLGGVFALFGAHIWVGQVANVVLGIGTCLLMYRLSLTMFNDRRAAGLGVALFALYLNQIGYTLALSTEVLYSFLVLAAFVVLSLGEKRLSIAFACGLVLGFAALTKAQTVLLPFVLAVYWAGRQMSWRGVGAALGRALVVYVGLAVVVLPWSMRNYLAFGHFVLNSTNGGLTLLVGNNPSANGNFTVEGAMVAEANAAIDAGDEVAADKLAHDLAVQWIAEHPLRVIALVPLKIWHLWAPDGDSENVLKQQFPDYPHFARLIRAIRWVDQAYYVLLMLGCALAIATLLRRGRFFEPMIYSGVAAFAFATLVAVIFFGLSRYRDFVMPWVTLYAGWFVSDWRFERRATLPHSALVRP